MATAELPRPGVEVIQEFRSSSPTIVRPTLVPFVCGPAKEIIDVLNTDGTLNSNAKQGQYAQLPLTVTQSAFPSPRGNIAQVNVEEASIEAFFQFGGALLQLKKAAPGESFLIDWNNATAAAIQTDIRPGGGWDLNGLVLVIAIDVTARLNLLKDVTITFAADDMTSDDVSAAINAAVGSDVAAATIDDRVQITSLKYGANSSVTIRPGGSANAILGFDVDTEFRVTGSGFRGQDQSNNTTLTPWIEWTQGEYLEDGTATTFPAINSGTAGYGLVDGTGTFSGSEAAPLTFTGGGSILLQAGDIFYADGTPPVANAVIKKVEAARFKLGVLNVRLSIFDADGNVVTAVYDDAIVNTLFAAVPFAPRYAWYKAENLSVSTVPQAAVLTGSVTGDAATSAIIEGSGTPSGPFTLTGLTLVFSVTVDGVTSDDQTFTFSGGSLSDMAAVATAIGSSITGVVAINDAGNLKFATSATGATQALVLRDTSSAGATLGFTFSGDLTATGTDVSISGLTGLNFEIRLNKRPHTYKILFASDSLVDALAAINAVVGWPVATLVSDQLTLTSDLLGLASEVQVIEVTETSAANTALGFAGGDIADGTGRPNPDFYLDISGNAIIGADILRNTVTGAPYGDAVADLYIQYTGLRLDVSPRSTATPTLISVSDVITLESILGPINQDNPLGLGLFFALINAPGVLCTGMGVSEATPAAPDGTLIAYTEVANFLESQEVYAIAPLTHDETIAQMFKAHVELMESPEQKGERILFFNPLVPLRANDIVVASGLNGSSSSTSDEFILDVNPISSLVSHGINPANPIPVSDNLFLQITVEGEVRIYNVSGVNGVVITLNTAFDIGENTDAFFTTTPLTESLVDEDYSLEIRGEPLLLPGSSLPDKDATASTVQAKAQVYGYRRMFYVFPQTVTANVNGVQSLLEAYHACAAIAGMCAHFPPQQGFTNMPMVGFNGVQGSQDTYSSRQLNVMAAGGTYILVQDAIGAPILSRMQLSTDTTTIEKRELSITKIVDFTAKFLRVGLRNFIGTFNITQPFLDTVSTVIHGMLKFLEENGILISGDLNNIIQSTDQPDTVLVDILLDVPFPCNYLRLTLVV